LEQLEWVGR